MLFISFIINYLMFLLINTYQKSKEDNNWHNNL